jgi:hypothetical protein
MAISEAFSGSEAALSTTEWSCPRDASYSAASTQTDDGVYQILLDVSDMVAADVLRIRLYEKVLSGSTQRVASEWTLRDAQAEPIWVSPSLILLHGWDVTITATTGTIAIDWSIRKVA